jgi:hypothetical protein
VVDNFPGILKTVCSGFWKPVHVATPDFQEPFMTALAASKPIEVEFENTSGFRLNWHY